MAGSEAACRAVRPTRSKELSMNNNLAIPPYIEVAAALAIATVLLALVRIILTATTIVINLGFVKVTVHRPPHRR
jgi:hypothetical protein